MSNFGQLMAVIDLANQIGFNTAQAVIRSKQIKSDLKLSEKELQLKQIQAQEELKLRDRDYALKLQAAARQEKLFKDIAIIAGIGITAVIGIIGVGVLIASRKGSSKK